MGGILRLQVYMLLQELQVQPMFNTMVFINIIEKHQEKHMIHQHQAITQASHSYLLSIKKQKGQIQFNFGYHILVFYSFQFQIYHVSNEICRHTPMCQFHFRTLWKSKTLIAPSVQELTNC